MQQVSTPIGPNTQGETILKKYDTLHDFGYSASNRYAGLGIQKLNLSMPTVYQKQPAPYGILPLTPRQGAAPLFRLNRFPIYNCPTNIRSKEVSYERAATAAIDDCALEKAWSYDTKKKNL